MGEDEAGRLDALPVTLQILQRQMPTFTDRAKRHFFESGIAEHRAKGGAGVNHTVAPEVHKIVDDDIGQIVSRIWLGENVGGER